MQYVIHTYLCVYFQTVCKLNITIKVLDSNDNFPVFTESDYSFETQDSNIQGSYIGNVSVCFFFFFSVISLIIYIVFFVSNINSIMTTNIKKVKSPQTPHMKAIDAQKMNCKRGIALEWAVGKLLGAKTRFTRARPRP